MELLGNYKPWPRIRGHWKSYCSFENMELTEMQSKSLDLPVWKHWVWEGLRINPLTSSWFFSPSSFPVEKKWRFVYSKENQQTILLALLEWSSVFLTLEVYQCFSGGGRWSRYMSSGWLGSVTFSYHFSPIEKSNRTPPILKMEFLVWYRQTISSTEQSPSTVRGFSACSLNSAFFSLLLSREIPQFVLWVSRKEEGFPEQVEPYHAAESKQHSPTISAVAPAPVAAWNHDSGRKGENFVLYAASHCTYSALQSLMAHKGSIRCCKMKILRPFSAF